MKQLVAKTIHFLRLNISLKFVMLN